MSRLRGVWNRWKYHLERHAYKLVAVRSCSIRLRTREGSLNIIRSHSSLCRTETLGKTTQLSGSAFVKPEKKEKKEGKKGQQKVGVWSRWAKRIQCRGRRQFHQPTTMEDEHRGSSEELLVKITQRAWAFTCRFVANTLVVALHSSLLWYLTPS